MAGIAFRKLHSSGNDFIVIIEQSGQSYVPPGQEPVLARRICRPHFGIGADGLMLVQGDKVRHFDPDGTLSFCINGSLCLARLLQEHPEIPHNFSLFHVPVTLAFEKGLSSLRFRPEMVQVQEMTVEGFAGRYVFVGNPHFFIHGYPNDIARTREKAEKIRHSSVFPNGTNVSFWEHNTDTVKILTFERGVEDFTLGCGSACAAFSAGMHRPGKTVFVPPSGSELIVSMDHETGTMTVTGEVTDVCKGTFFLS
jgi:diaminopimelate epimerase